MTSRLQLNPVNDFDSGPGKVGGARYAQVPRPSTKVRLRNRETGEVADYYNVDAAEILKAPGTLYERVEPDNDDAAPFTPEAA